MGSRKPCDGIAGVRMVAREQLFCDFEGKNAHAGGNPWDGINALDAFVASYNNLSMLRQQTNDTDRIHSAILEAPKAANIIPAQIRAMFTTRSETLKSLKALTARVTKCIEAGALATGCTLKIEKYSCPPVFLGCGAQVSASHANDGLYQGSILRRHCRQRYLVPAI